MPSWLPISCSVQMLACCSAEMALASRSMRCFNSGLEERCAGKTLMATVRSRRVSLAR